ncbi:hypothetical protein ACH0CM_28010, partial [Streptomyces albus]
MTATTAAITIASVRGGRPLRSSGSSRRSRSEVMAPLPPLSGGSALLPLPAPGSGPPPSVPPAAAPSCAPVPGRAARSVDDAPDAGPPAAAPDREEREPDDEDDAEDEEAVGEEADDAEEGADGAGAEPEEDADERLADAADRPVDDVPGVAPGDFADRLPGVPVPSEPPPGRFVEVEVLGGEAGRGGTAEPAAPLASSVAVPR